MKASIGRLWPTASIMRYEFGRLSSCFLTATMLAAAGPLAAQVTSTSQPVVQPLPPPAIEDLNVALRRLARDAHDLDALIDAGNASLELNDVAAAVGFFGRAQELSPQNARVKLGLAGAYVRSERPIEALHLFDEAALAGATGTSFAGDRGLAYDLVGDNAAAQAQYRLALAQGSDEEVVRRLALSQAIIGDRQGFEKTLYPQLAKQDFAAFRARAFGLAILGQEEEAVAIAEAVMPADLAARIAPYLRYMRRLTKAQQAAAANLGMFPRAAQIGRDDPRIAQYTANAAAVPGADARLEPKGEPLARRDQTETAAPRRRPDRGSSTVAASRDTAKAAPQRTASAAPAREFDPRTRIVPQQQAPQPQVQQPRIQQPQSRPQPVQSQPRAEQAVASAQASSQGGELPPVSGAASEQVATVSQPVVQSVPPSQQPTVQQDVAPANPAGAQPTRIALGEPVAEPGFDLGRVGPATAPATAAGTGEAVPAQELASVTDAFAAFALAPSDRAAPSAGAVDITAIKPPREVEEKPPAKPAPPKHPSRFWVQVATGKDRGALKWDWRRISRKAPEILGDFKPMTTPWGEANRLLAGPYKSEKAADEAVSKLREAGLDSFEFTSDEGQAIDPLD